MPKYHFSLGDSSKGPVGLGGEVTADSPEEAVAQFQALLPEHVPVVPSDDAQYVNVYFNPPVISVDDIDDIEEDDDEDEVEPASGGVPTL